MKIVVIGTRGFPNVQGGVEKHCEELYPKLVNLGVDVTVITRSSYVKEKIKSFKGVKFIHLFSIRKKSIETIVHTFFAILKLHKLKPDIVHIHTIGVSLLIPLVKFQGYKVVMTHHGPDYMRKKWKCPAKFFLKKGEENATKYSNAIISVSNWIKEYIENKYGRFSHFIPNGVSAITDFDKNSNFKYNTLEKFKITAKNYILTVSRFVPEKGIEDLINAYALINNPAFKLVIAGGADHETSYSKYIKKLSNKTEGVILTGTLFKEDLFNLYKNSSLFILASYYEGFPISLLEALSFGIPFLITDIPAHREIKIQGFRYFSPGNVNELSDKIISCVKQSIDEKEKLYYLNTIKSNYDWDDIAAKTFNVYKNVLNI